MFGQYFYQNSLLINHSKASIADKTMENMCLQSLILKNEKSFYAFTHFKIFGANSTCELCYDTSTYKHDDMYFICTIKMDVPIL